MTLDAVRYDSQHWCIHAPKRLAELHRDIAMTLTDASNDDDSVNEVEERECVRDRRERRGIDHDERMRAPCLFEHGPHRAAGKQLPGIGRLHGTGHEHIEMLSVRPRSRI